MEQTWKWDKIKKNQKLKAQMKKEKRLAKQMELSKEIRDLEVVLLNNEK